MLKKLTLVVTILALILMMSANVFATNANVAGNNTTGGNVTEIVIGNQTSNPANNVNNTNVANNTTNNTNAVNNPANNTNVSNYTNSTKLPQTGIDSSVLFIIAIFAVSAIYAYKKIRDYNN